jgi:hypothetical protein
VTLVFKMSMLWGPRTDVVSFVPNAQGTREEDDNLNGYLVA